MRRKENSNVSGDDKADRQIYFWEPWFFIFFGIFHLHRIWALIDRASYASFWMGILENKGWPYFLIMGLLGTLCVLGIITFVRSLKHNYLWRWIYIMGGAYLLFDLFAIATGMKAWMDLLSIMFDTHSGYWVPVWSSFIVMGAAVSVLGIILLRKRSESK